MLLKLHKGLLLSVLLVMSWECVAQVTYYATGFGQNSPTLRGSTPQAVANLAEVYLNSRLPVGNSFAYKDCRPGIDLSAGNGQLFDHLCTLYNTGDNPSFPCCTEFSPNHRVGAIGRQTCPASQNTEHPFDIFNDQTMQCGCSNPEYEARNRTIGSVPQVGCFETPEDDAQKDDGCNSNGVGNPCNVATGNKHQAETDISSGTLRFSRFYNSNNLVDLGLGKGWRSSFQKRLVVDGDTLTLISAPGRGEPWIKSGEVWVGDDDSDVSISESATGFTVIHQNDHSESYGLSGKILSETNAQGQTTVYVYNENDSELLASVSNHYGQSLAFSYDDNGRLATVTDALDEVYIYQYSVINNLEKVIFPDRTPNNSSDNPTRTYHYENPQYPNHLTGITDENGDRYATWAYDSDGKAISTEHAQTTNTVGQEKFELDYQGSN